MKPLLAQQQQANTDAQFTASTDWRQTAWSAVVDTHQTNSKMTEQVLSSEQVMAGFRDVVLRLFTDALTKGGGGAGAICAQNLVGSAHDASDVPGGGFFESQGKSARRCGARSRRLHIRFISAMIPAI